MPESDKNVNALELIYLLLAEPPFPSYFLIRN